MPIASKRPHRPIVTTKVRTGVRFSEIRPFIPGAWQFVGDLLDISPDIVVFVISMPSGRVRTPRVFSVLSFDRGKAKNPLAEMSGGVYTRPKDARWAAVEHRNRIVAEVNANVND